MPVNEALSEVFSAGLVELELSGATREEVVAELVGILDRAGKLISGDAFLSDVLERERLLSTFCGDGLAIPHAASAAVGSAAVAFGRSRRGIRWGAEEDLAQVIFLLAAPRKAAAEDHLEALSAIARAALDPGVHSTWLNAESAEEIVESLHTVR